jgi:hypothetical protein
LAAFAERDAAMYPTSVNYYLDLLGQGNQPRRPEDKCGCPSAVFAHRIRLKLRVTNA